MCAGVLCCWPKSQWSSSDDVPKTRIRSVSNWRPNPRHPGPNFTGFRVQLNCIEPHDQRARRPSVNWFPLRTMTYNSSANLCSREAVTGTRANLQDVKSLRDHVFRSSTSPLFLWGQKFGGDVNFCFSPLIPSAPTLNFTTEGGGVPRGARSNAHAPASPT